MFIPGLKKDYVLLNFRTECVKEAAAAAVPVKTITNLTESVEKRLFEVIRPGEVVTLNGSVLTVILLLVFINTNDLKYHNSLLSAQHVAVMSYF